MTNMGRFYELGEGVDRDGGKAIEWYTRAADKGYTMAMRLLSGAYLTGRTVKQDEEKE